MPDDPVAMQQQEANLQSLFENLRLVAVGTGIFASNTTRDAAIRTIARVLMVFLRNRLGKNDAAD